ncbi:MAG: hypothetical protein H6Q55_3573 [Deltaproteobacteria bacterium]|jgi:hypothetical protein|nr:hypothetical protein [Deltaproteobacteria bacterium]
MKHQKHKRILIPSELPDLIFQSQYMHARHQAA